MNKIKGFIIFSLGVATGSLATWRYFKTKYEQIAQEEIDSVKERFSKFKKSEAPVEKQDEPVQDQAVYNEIVHENGYVNYSGIRTKETKTEKNDMSDAPYVISPDEFGDLGYETISLTYYAEDGMLTDDSDDPIDNIDEIVGTDSLFHFGEYEEDSVHVRNDRLQCDYEILLDQGKYHDHLKPQQG